MCANFTKMVLLKLAAILILSVGISAKPLFSVTDTNEHIFLEEFFSSNTADSQLFENTAEHEFGVVQIGTSDWIWSIAGDLNISFPNVSGWRKSGVNTYPQKSLGYSVSYQSSDGERISAYVYDNGLSSIPDGIDSNAVKRELKAAESGIYYIEEQGTYKNVKKISGGTVTLNGEKNGIKSLRSTFEFSVRGNKVTSDILIFGYKDHFIKFRATRLKKESDSANKALKTFWKKMDDLFSGKIESKELKVEYPDVKGWEKGELRTYSNKALGSIINYESPTGGRISVYVYDAGLGEIPDGVGSRVVKDEIINAAAGIYLYEERGSYKNVKKIRDETITLNGEKGGVKSLYSLFNFSVRGDKVTSEIYVFGYKNHFVKFRATRPREDNNDGDREVAKFMRTLNDLFSK